MKQPHPTHDPRHGLALWPYLRPYRGHLLASMACVAAGAASAMALVPLARHAAEVFGHLTLPALNGVVLALVGLYTARSLFGFGANALGAFVALRVTAELREAVFAHLLDQRLAFFRRQRTAELSSRLVQDLGVLREALATMLGEFVPSLVILAYSLGYIAWLNWHLALFTLFGMPLVGWAIAAFGSRLHVLSGDVQSRVGDVFVRAQETLGAMVVVKAFGREAEELARFSKANREHREATWRGALVAALQGPVIASLQTAAIGMVLWVGGYEIVNGRMQSADLLAFAAAIAIAVDPTLALSQAWGKLQQALGASARVRGLLAEHDALPESVSPVRLAEVAGAIALEGVGFAYESGRPVLEDISFTVAPGEVVALVGPSGSGKTTLAQLVLRLHDPDRGRVMLDGVDLRDLATADLRRVTAYVSQEPLLFAGTIAENVAFGCPGATRSAIASACEAANAAEFIDELPAGYDTPLGEGGAGLSGGQRQRLAIARALLADPRLLVLDEATSALDGASERAVREAIARLMVGRTTLIIAHRMAAIERADRVVFLDHGRVVEIASREALSARGDLARGVSPFQ